MKVVALIRMAAKINKLNSRYSSDGEILMKFGNLFKKGKAQPKNEDTHPPEELIACPYCGHKYWIRGMTISSMIAQNYKVREWLGRFHCVGGMHGGGCGQEFWIVGSYGEIKYTKPFGS